jgi:hypothetical protein
MGRSKSVTHINEEISVYGHLQQIVDHHDQLEIVGFAFFHEFRSPFQGEHQIDANHTNNLDRMLHQEIVLDAGIWNFERIKSLFSCCRSS